MDRNDAVQIVIVVMHASLSARRAWIEMVCCSRCILQNLVALRKESVDRNGTMQIVIVIVNAVALRKESVDRNACVGFH